MSFVHRKVKNLCFSPQTPIATSFADHFCSSQSKKKPQKKMFFLQQKITETKLNSIVYEHHVCSVAEKLQFYTWFHVEVLMNLPSCLSCYLFLDSITLNNEWSLWAVRWFPTICDAKRFSCNFGFFAFLPSKRFVISGDAFVTSDCKCFMRCIICNFKSQVASLYLFTNLSSVLDWIKNSEILNFVLCHLIIYLKTVWK